MLVTGSIIRPRIFISTSMRGLPGLRHLLADQAVGPGAGYLNLHVGSQKVALLGSEIYNFVTSGVAAPLIFATRFTADQHFKPGIQQRSVALGGNFTLLFLQNS